MEPFSCSNCRHWARAKDRLLEELAPQRIWGRCRHSQPGTLALDTPVRWPLTHQDNVCEHHSHCAAGPDDLHAWAREGAFTWAEPESWLHEV